MITKWENAQSWKVDRVDQAVDQFVGASNLNTLSCFIFSPVSSGSSRVCQFNYQRVIFLGYYNKLRASNWFLEAKVLDLGRLLLLQCVTVSFSSILIHLGFRVCVFLFLPALSPLFLHFSWLLGKSRLPLGHRANAQPTCLSLLRWKLTKRRGLTRPSSALWRIIIGTSKNLLRGK